MMLKKGERFEYVNKKENICPYIIDHKDGVDYTGHDLNILSKLLNKYDKQVNDLNQYCISGDDTLITILELVDILFNENGIMDLILIYKGLKAIRDVDLEEMNKLIMEEKVDNELYGDVNDYEFQ